MRRPEADALDLNGQQAPVKLAASANTAMALTGVTEAAATGRPRRSATPGLTALAQGQPDGGEAGRQTERLPAHRGPFAASRGAGDHEVEKHARDGEPDEDGADVNQGSIDRLEPPGLAR